MYGDGPQKLNISQAELAALCPGSYGTGTKRPAGALTRWIAVRDAIVQWYQDEQPDDTSSIEADLFGFLDRLQQDECVARFKAWRTIFPERPQSFEFDPPGASIVSDDEQRYLDVPFHVELTNSNGQVERLRIKLSTPSSPVEQLIVTEYGDSEVEYSDVLLSFGQMEPIEAPEFVERTIEDLFHLGEGMGIDKSLNPGFHCWMCNRFARCGQYPTPDRTAPPANTLSVMLPKSRLKNLEVCERRVAWKTIYQVPVPPADDEFGSAHRVGLTFHDAIAAAVLSPDPDDAMAGFRSNLPGSEQGDFDLLWEAHKQLVATEPHPVTISRVEFPFGVTLPADGGRRSVTLSAVVDAVGREATGKAAVIEHRTTVRSDIPFLEQELYAVATWLSTGATEVAVHHHHLRAAPDDRCTRRLFGAEDLNRALERLRDAGEVVAAWDYEDALQPSFSVGPHCQYCEFKPTCENYRT
jgi:hypothetical protein